MGLNFRKSISLGKGLRINLSKSGPSVSFGKSGFRQSINLKGQARTTVGIPGTGVYYTKTSNVKNVVGGLTGKDTKGKKGKGDADAKKAAKAAPAARANNEELIAQSQAQIQDFAAGLEALKSVHKQSDGYIDWETVKNGAV